VYKYTQYVLVECLPLRKAILCHVDMALKTLVQCLSSAKAAHKLLGISRKEIEGKRENIIIVLYKCFVLLPPPQRGITRLGRQLAGNWDDWELDEASIQEEQGHIYVIK